MTQTPVASDVHVLRVESVELVGGFRTVTLQSGYNLVRGDITTGKTTFVRLLRGLLGAIPRHLPPETAAVRSIAAQLVLGSRQWQVLRPLVTTKDTPVEVAEAGTGEGDPGIALRLPAAGAGGFGEFLLKRLAVPVVLVPKARHDPTAELSPVTINDWLNYCIVPGDELDAQVFGHRDAFRDSKRKWVFEVLYGLYDAELAELNAEVSRLDKLIASTRPNRRSSRSSSPRSGSATGAGSRPRRPCRRYPERDFSALGMSSPRRAQRSRRGRSLRCETKSSSSESAWTSQARTNETSRLNSTG